MSRFIDSRDPHFGYLILQDHGFKIEGKPTHARGSLVGVRVKGRHDTNGEYGEWNEDKEARGTLDGALLWQRTDQRTGGWSWIRPTITPSSSVTPTSVGDTTTRRSLPSITGVSVSEQKFVTTAAHYQFAKSKGFDVKYSGLRKTEDGYVLGDKPISNAQAYGYIMSSLEAHAPKGIVGVGGPSKIGLPPFPGAAVGVPIPLGAGGGVGVFGGGFLGKAAKDGAWAGLGAYIPLIGGNYQPRFVLTPDPGGNPVNVLANANKSSDTSDNQPSKVKAWYSGMAAFDRYGEDRFTEGVYPITDSWVADKRFEKIDRISPEGWPDIPRGYYTLSVVSTNEDRQSVLHMPADPRLIAPHRTGPSTLGTPVCDISAGQNIDPIRNAPLHSMLRVIRQPTGAVGALSANDGRKEPHNSLAWVIGPTGLGDTFGGLVIDGSVLATMSSRMGGPFATGGSNDRHRIGSDADGTPINRGHIPTDALFLFNDAEDGPLTFTHNYPEFAQDLTWPVKVYNSWRASVQRWDYWTTAEIYEPGAGEPPPHGGPPTGGPPTTTPPSGGPEDQPGNRRDPGDPVPGWDTPTEGIDPGDPPFPPKAPPRPGGPSFRDPRRGRIDPTALFDAGSMSGPAMTRYIALSGIAGRPTKMELNGRDLRFDSGARLDERNSYDRDTPLIGRIEPYGAQGGPSGGDYLGGGDWTYTQDPSGISSWPGGTANGGWVIMPPEVNLAAIDDDLAPTGLDRSTTYLVAGPGSRMAVGLPELSTGGVKSGVSMEKDTDGDLLYHRHDTAGAVDGNLDLKLLNIAEGKHRDGADFLPADLNDWTDDTVQKQFGVREDVGNQKLQFNLAGTIVGVNLT